MFWEGRNPANITGAARSEWTTLGLSKLTVCAFWFYTVQDAGCSAGHCPKRALGFMHFSGLTYSGSGSRVLRVLCKGTDSVGRAFCALPRSEQLTRPGAWSVDSPRWAIHLNHLSGLRCAMCLLWGADLRLQLSWQMSTIQDPRKMWLTTGGLLTVWWRMPVSEAEIGAAPCHLALAVTHLPLFLWQGGDYMQLASSPLVITESFAL